jgi:hypothetical protein
MVECPGIKNEAYSKSLFLYKNSKNASKVIDKASEGLGEAWKAYREGASELAEIVIENQGKLGAQEKEMANAELSEK